MLPVQFAENEERIQKEFLWNSGTAKIKHKTICSDFKNVGFKMQALKH